MKNKVLITGGAGYIGSVFVRQLLEKKYLVTVLDNFMYNQNSLLDVCYHPSLDIVVGDVRNEELLKKEIMLFLKDIIKFWNYLIIYMVQLLLLYVCLI